MTGSEAGSAKILWLRAGQQLLRHGGIGAVKLNSLEEEAGLTTGSFYYHFTGMSEYLGTLADFWGRDTPGHIEEAANPDPRQRILELSAIAPREDLHRLDRAMRDWAGSDSRAAASVKRVDEALLTFMAEAFAELGFDEGGARLCAQVMLANGVARITPPWPAIEDQVERLLNALTRHLG